MSIISDALKKARESRIRGSVSSSSPSPAPQLPPAAGYSQSRVFAAPATRDPNVRRGAPWFVLLLTIVIGGPLCFPLAAKFIGDAKSGGAVPSGRTLTTRGQFSIEERPVFMGSDRPAFSLSGIAQFQESFMAVVNGHILKQGDEIGGAKVVAISADAVELEYRGERIVLEKTF